MRKFHSKFLIASVIMGLLNGCSENQLTPDLTVCSIEPAKEQNTSEETFIAKSFDNENTEYYYSYDNIISSIFFDFDSAKINQNFIEKINDTAKDIRTKTFKEIIVVGSCDRFGKQEYNFALGRKRAQAVKDILVSNGIDESKIELASKGSSEADPFANKISGEKDRRADIILK